MGRLKYGKRKRPQQVIGIIGCMAQKEGKLIFRRAPYVDIVAGTAHFTKIDEYVRQSQELAITDSYDALTAREREVLQLIAEGNTNREIATQLHISVKTAGVHRNNIMQKLHLTTMAELTRYAIRKGIISLEQ